MTDLLLVAGGLTAVSIWTVAEFFTHTHVDGRRRSSTRSTGGPEMAVLRDRLPTLSHRIHNDPAGPPNTRPFGLDALTNSVAVDGRQPVMTLDPTTQLSIVDGQIAVENPTMANTSCTTESDGADAIALDTDTNDD